MTVRGVKWRVWVCAVVTLLGVLCVTPARAESPAWAFAYPGDEHGPGRWDACKPITWKIRTLRAPVGVQAEIEATLGYIGSVTGLRFEYGGEASADEAREGADQTVVFRFVKRGALPKSVAGSAYVRAAKLSDGRVVLRRAIVQLRPDVPRMVSGRNEWRRVLLHELGHVIGLVHVSRRGVVMNPYLTKYTSFRAAELPGVTQLGAASGCNPMPGG